MSNVLGALKDHLRSRSVPHQARSSVDTASPNIAAWDSEFLRRKGSSLRLRALAEDEEYLVVSSPKDRKFQSLPWDALKDREQLESFSPTSTPTPTPISGELGIPTSAKYASHHEGHSFDQPRLLHNSGQNHRRTTSTPLATTSTTSTGWKPFVLFKRMPIASKSDSGPHITSIPTINETNDATRKHSNNKSPPIAPVAKPTIHQNTHGVVVLAYQPRPRDCLLQDSQPKIQKPSFIDLPRHLPPELQVHTPEYTNALKQWFPAMTQ